MARRSRLQDGDRVLVWRGERTGAVGVLSDVDGYEATLTYVNDDGSRPGGSCWVQLHNCKRYDGPVSCRSCGRFPEEQATVVGPCEIPAWMACPRRTGTPYQIRVQPDFDDGGYVSECVELPGCYGQGETIPAAMRDVTEAIKAVLVAQGGDPQQVRERGVVNVTPNHEVAFNLRDLNIQAAPTVVRVVDNPTFQPADRTDLGIGTGRLWRANTSLSWVTYWLDIPSDGRQASIGASRDNNGWVLTEIILTPHP